MAVGACVGEGLSSRQLCGAEGLIACELVDVEGMREREGRQRAAANRSIIRG